MSGWKTATIKNIDKQEQINQTIENKQIESIKNSIAMAGYEADIQDEIAEILHEAEVENGQVLVIEANDTTDSGNGTLYDIKELNEDGTVTLTQIDSKRGYEGARARDVTGYFREQHKIDGFARIH